MPFDSIPGNSLHSLDHVVASGVSPAIGIIQRPEGQHHPLFNIGFSTFGPSIDGQSSLRASPTQPGPVTIHGVNNELEQADMSEHIYEPVHIYANTLFTDTWPTVLPDSPERLNSDRRVHDYLIFPESYAMLEFATYNGYP
ncbi:hypothetical protein NLI96_g5824 [Meripilus lineatus]|uniref:Uncharacterized protein n=1 Tax=Meripilus lineatus TaxID=2056292 RepID=A0AAD5V7N8_9APHY|nr:hypothetical protein NLI96_g5824 [Physisporinus lineatus]